MIDDATLRREPDQRGRRRRHVPAAAQRHRALAAARVPPRLGARGREHSFDELVALARGRRRRFARFIDPNDPALRRARRHAGARSGAYCAADRPGASPRRPARSCAASSRASRSSTPRPSTCSRGDRRRRRPRSTSSAAARTTSCSAAGRRAPPACPCSPGPAEATLLGNLLVQAMALGELALARGGSRGRARLVRAVDLRARGAGWHEARERFAAVARPGAGGRRVSERRACCTASPRRRTAGTTAAGGARRARRARLPLEPARRRPRAREPGRRQHVDQGDGRRPRRPRAARALGQGLGHRPRDDHAPRASRAAAGRACCRCANADEMDDATMVDYLAALRARARPAAAVDRDAAARVRAGAARRPHAPRRRDRADLDARGRGLAEEAFGDEAVWLDYQRPGFDMSRRIARAARRESAGARGPAREARPRHLGRDAARRATRRRSSSSRARRAAIDGRGSGRLRPRRAEGRGARGGRGGRLLASALPALRGALLADTDGVDPRDRPQPRGGRVRVARRARPR